MTLAEEEWDVNEGVMTKGDSSVFDDLIERMVNMISKLQLDNQLLLISVLQVIGGYSYLPLISYRLYNCLSNKIINSVEALVHLEGICY